MNKQRISLLLAGLMTLSLLAGCGSPSPSGSTSASSPARKTSQVAGSSEMAAPAQVTPNGAEPVYGSALKDGVYPITVDSSSSMFNITSCELTVQDGKMTAVMTMGGTGYRYVYMGTGEEAAAAEESAYIPFAETEEGAHTFTVPVEALDTGLNCAAFSKKKEKWYDRILVFRADSLPAEARSDDATATVESLKLADGTYTVEVALEGGSGRATVVSPAQLTVQDGKATAAIVWSSSNYDYMKVDGVHYDPTNTEGNSTFEIPVTGFDAKLPVLADTTAMSTPHEIEYTLRFDSATLKAQ